MIRGGRPTASGVRVGLNEGSVEELLFVACCSVAGPDQLQAELDRLADVGVRIWRCSEYYNTLFVDITTSKLSPALPPSTVRQPDLDVLLAHPLAHQDHLLAAPDVAGVVRDVDDLELRHNPGGVDGPGADWSQLVSTAATTLRLLYENLNSNKVRIGSGLS